jgi:hypothetical protein
MKRLGPEIKMPSLKQSDLKVPPVLSDLYWDLRDRRLLPIVALLIVAIIAAPILLNKGSDTSGPTRAPVIATGATSKGGRLTVVEAQPGLRNPSMRFAHRKPTDPFKQRFTAPQVAKAEENAVTTTQASSGSTAGGGAQEAPVVTVNETPAGGGAERNASSPAAPPSTPSSPSSPTTPSSPNGPSERGGSGTGEGGGSNESSPLPEGGSGEIHYFVWTAKIQIAHTETTSEGSTEMGEPEVRESVHSLTPLPGVKLPVLTFIGVDTGTENGIFLISREVTARSGKGNCRSGGTSCELVELETGAPATFEYGPDHARWKFKVLSTQLIRVKNSVEDRSSKLKDSAVPKEIGRVPRPRS